MSRTCQMTSKSVMTGNNVSHAHRKTRRRFLPNLQQVSLESQTLGRRIRMRISTRALRTIDKKGGLDLFLLTTPNRRLAPLARKLKGQMMRLGAEIPAMEKRPRHPKKKRPRPAKDHSKGRRQESS